MSISTAVQKGDTLEKAVQTIEALILHSNEATRNAIVTIEQKKIVIVDGVKHEIDIFTTIDYGKGYTSIFIFECKNWEVAIGKNEIIVFSEKIQAVQAQKGYFIAKSFGEFAVAQAKKDKRIELLIASDKLDPLPSFTNNFHLVLSNVVQTNLIVHLTTDEPEIINALTFTEESRVKVGNEELFLKAFRERLQQVVINEVINHEPTGLFTEGVYPYKKTQTVKFQQKELSIEGNQCEAIEVEAIWEVHIIHPKIVSKFDIQTRGRIITYDFDQLPTGGNITTSFIDIYRG